MNKGVRVVEYFTDKLLLSDNWIADSDKFIFNRRTKSIHKILHIGYLRTFKSKQGLLKVENQHEIKIGDILERYSENKNYETN